MNQVKSRYFASVPFEAARQVEFLPVGHRSHRLHGHSFIATVQAVLPDGWASFKGAEVTDLQAHLTNCLTPLDYQHLNKVVESPTDENLARWIQGQISVPGIETVGIQSTRHEGANVSGEKAHIWRRYTFEAAHQLPNVPTGHKCGRMHGHTFDVIIHASQSILGKNMGVDYDRLDELWAPIHQALHLNCLNDISGLDNPTSEVIASWIWEQLHPVLPELAWVTVYETASCGAHFDGKDYRIWKDMSFDSALRLNAAPEGHPRRRIHGGTFTLRLHLSAPLNTVMGWTIDFGDVKSLFDPIFKAIDHRPLFQIDGLPDNDLFSLSSWIRLQAAPILPELYRIDLFSAPGSGIALTWGDQAPTLPI